MRLIALALFIIFVCSAATCDQAKPTKGISITCERKCFERCTDLTPWDGDRAKDALTALMDTHDGELWRCDGQRALCAACLGAADKSGGIQLKESE